MYREAFPWLRTLLGETGTLFETSRKGRESHMLAIYPIKLNSAGQPEYEQLPFAVFKGLQRTVLENVINSNFTLNMIEGLRIGYALAPNNWKALVKKVTSPAQNTVFARMR